MEFEQLERDVGALGEGEWESGGGGETEGLVLTDWFLCRAEQLSVETGSIELGHHKAQAFRVAGVIIHQDYDHSSLDNDIAMVELQTPIAFSQDQLPVLLPLSDQFDIEDWKPCFVIGWGITQH
ncbi:hypothetical protein chiPu_0025206, partial [Chiloscyllium punctatum]|nr:hypothetical protein [Chiloscyllium punctatum]